MWHIREHKSIPKTIGKIPLQVIKKYELWKDIIFRHGPFKLREFPGFNDEKLEGKLEGYRSSRLNIQYRVIYQIENEEISVYVIEITPHKY
jgi:Txe/YoeB family toxin of Txe-Axe toxin-antitoxin module